MPHPPVDAESAQPHAIEDSAEADAAEAKKFRDLQSAAELGNVAAVRSFLRTEPEKLERRKGGGKDTKTSLMLAATNGHVEVVKLLLAAGAMVDAINYTHHPSVNGAFKTALHMAAESGHAEVVQLLLAAGAYIDLRDQHGYSALHFAALNGHVVVAELLLASGFHVDATTEKDPSRAVMEPLTPLYYAARFGHEAMIELLLNAGAKIDGPPSAIGVAVDSGHAGVVQQLLTKGATMPRGVLHYAASNGDVELVKVLLAAGASTNARTVEVVKRLLADRYVGSQGPNFSEVLKLLEAAKARQDEQSALREAQRKAEEDSRPKRCFGLCPRR